MKTVDIEEAKTHLSRLLDRAAKGETITIAKAGKPIAKLVPLDEAPKKVVQRIGFMEGESVIPDDIKTPFKYEIEEMFYGKP
jgi:prevent-host-death family protein